MGKCVRANKTSYRDEQASHRAMRNAGKLASKTGAYPTRAYKCPFGNHWHITSQDSR